MEVASFGFFAAIDLFLRAFVPLWLRYLLLVLDKQDQGRNNTLI